MRFLSATKIFSGTTFLPSNSVLVIDERGLILDVSDTTAIDTGKTEMHEGIICPGFINTHCHLELSHLKHKVPQHTGIVDFGLHIIRSRNDMPEVQQLEFMQQADKEMYRQGIVMVGDISNNALSIPVKKNSSLRYHTFVELIALNPERAESVFDIGKTVLAEYEKQELKASLAPHAPYTVSMELIGLINADCKNRHLPTSIHNQESRAENEFFQKKTGDYLRLYETLNLQLDYFKATGKSSLQSILNVLEPALNTLLVHNTFTDADDLSMALKHPQLFWCLCANANLYIENTLPDIDLLLANGCCITLGTDSLASNTQLSVAEEINTILKHKPHLGIEPLLKAATYNGALFLGADNELGLLEKNRKPGINLLSEKNNIYSVRKLA